MHIFIVAMCWVASVMAAPQGYNYQQNAVSSGLQSGAGRLASSLALEGPAFLKEAIENTRLTQSLLGQATTNSAVVQTTYQNPQQHSVQHQQQQLLSLNYGAPSLKYQPAASASSTSFALAQQQQLLPLNNIAPPQLFQPTASASASDSTSPLFALAQQQQQQQHHQLFAPIAHQGLTPASVPALVTKDIYVHVPPQDEEQQHHAAAVPAAPPRKHYRIVFIKAPTPSISQAAQQVSQAPIEEKTIIYVLSKKHDPIELEAALQEMAYKQPSKPEVYFIKYKTQEEAQLAQRTIQAQYDQLGGTTQVSDEGIAPVSSVVGALDHQQGAVEGAASANTISSTSQNNGYLPPFKRI